MLAGDVWVESKPVNQRTKASWGSKETEMLSEDGLGEQVCAFTLGSFVCIGRRAMGVCLPEGVWRPEVPREPFSPSVPSLFPERIVLFLSEERDLPIEKHGLCEEHLTQRLTTNTGKWQRSTPLVLSRYNAYMRKSFSSHVFLEINGRINCCERNVLSSAQVKGVQTAFVE